MQVNWSAYTTFGLSAAWTTHPPEITCWGCMENGPLSIYITGIPFTVFCGCSNPPPLTPTPPPPAPTRTPFLKSTPPCSNDDKWLLHGLYESYLESCNLEINLANNGPFPSFTIDSALGGVKLFFWASGIGGSLPHRVLRNDQTNSTCFILFCYILFCFDIAWLAAFCLKLVRNWTIDMIIINKHNFRIARAFPYAQPLEGYLLLLAL